RWTLCPTRGGPSRPCHQRRQGAEPKPMADNLHDSSALPGEGQPREAGSGQLLTRRHREGQTKGNLLTGAPGGGKRQITQWNSKSSRTKCNCKLLATGYIGGESTMLFTTFGWMPG